MCTRIWATGVLIWLALLHPCLCWSAVSGGADFTAALGYLDLGKGGQARQILYDAAGNIVVVGTISEDQIIAYGSPTPTGKIVVTKLDRADRTLFRFVFGGSGYNVPTGAAIDGHGNIYVVGATLSPSYYAGDPTNSLNDFPLVNALMPNARGPAFVAKVDPTGSHLLFSTRLGGIVSLSNAGGLALDSQANVYVTGSTNVSDFPITPGAFQSNPPSPRTGAAAAFVLKVSSAGDRLIYSTLLGGANAVSTGSGAIAVDSSGQATVAGSTVDRDFPVTPSAFQTVCSCGLLPPAFNTLQPQYLWTGFVTRLNATGTALVWSTYLGGSGSSAVLNGLVYGGGGVSALVLDDTGVFLTGQTASLDFPTTPGVVQPTVALRADFGSDFNVQMGFAAKMNASGTALLYSTYLAGKRKDIASAIAVDRQGRAWVTGTTTSPDFPSLPGSLSLGNAFLLELDTAASRLLRSYRVPAGSAGQGFAMISPSEIATLGIPGAVTRWSFGVASAPSVLAIANAAATVANGHVVPGELVSIYGVGLGPTPGLGAQIDQNGRVATSLSGAQVLFDGKPAPLLYVSDTQINAVVPFGISGNTFTALQVLSSSGLLPSVSLRVDDADPRVFRNADGDAAALNEDGTINGATNPARLGSIVVLWVNGAGLLDPLPTDGSITRTLLAKPVLPVSVKYAGQQCDVVYAGAAPGLVAGVLQLNARLPTGAVGLNNFIQLTIGKAVSENVRIYTSPP